MKNWARNLIFGGFLTLGINFANAENLKGDFSRYLDELTRLEDALKAEPACQGFVDQANSSCSSITDNFCSTLWNNKNRGNMEVLDGNLLTGISPRSKNRLYTLEHYQALADSLERLPADLITKAAPALKTLQEVLAEEKNLKGDPILWQRKLNDAVTEFNRAVADVSIKRKKDKYPDVMEKAPQDRTAEETMKVDAIEHKLNDEILDARYKDHPNWKRVERVYEQAKEDILKEIGSLNIAQEQKEILSNKIRTAELSLPYTNPDKVGADKDCGTTTVNAYYFRMRNVLVACAGFFNAYQSEAALYHVIAHELGHSIDSNAQAEHDCRSKSSVSKALNKLVGSAGPAYSCADWEKLKLDGPLKANEQFQNYREKHPLEKLTACLKDRSKLDPLTIDSVKGAVDRSVRSDVSWYATNNLFLTIAQPTVTKYGETKKNDYFLRPDVQMRAWYGNGSDGRLQRDADPLEIFAQALSCQTVSKDGKKVGYLDAESPQDKSIIFQQAIHETASILKIKEQDFISYCGQACSSLVGENLATNTGENFADWIAIRAGKHYISRISNTAKKREASALATSLFCSEPGIYNEAPHLALIEKGFSLQQHPDERIRRISYYTLGTAKALGCTVDPDAQGFALCEP